MDMQNNVVAKFEDYAQAVACLPAMARILRITLAVPVLKYNADTFIPKGCYADNLFQGSAHAAHIVARCT